MWHFTEPCDMPRAAIIRQPIVQATPDTFPASWHTRMAERQVKQPRPGLWEADQTSEA